MHSSLCSKTQLPLASFTKLLWFLQQQLLCPHNAHKIDVTPNKQESSALPTCYATIFQDSRFVCSLFSYSYHVA